MMRKRNLRLRRRKLVQRERCTQDQIVSALRLDAKPGVLICATPTYGGRVRTAGYLAGWPDIVITGPGRDAFDRHVVTVLALEVKSKTGRTSKEQREVLSRLREIGWHIAIVRSTAEALEALKAAKLSNGKVQV